jgi:hypothetical protein
LLLVVLVFEIGFLQRIGDPAELSTDEWLICLGLALVLLAYEEVAKFFLRGQRKGEAVAAMSDGSIQPVREQQDLAA